MADQNITALPVSDTPASSDQLLLVGATEEKLIDYDKLADAILNKLTSKNFSLDQGTMPLIRALNELNSKAFRTIDVSFLKTKMYLYKANNVVTITYTGDTTNNLIPKGDLGIVGVLPKEYIPDTTYIFLNVQINNVKIQLNFYADGNIQAYNYGEQIQAYNSCRYSGAYVVK